MAIFTIPRLNDGLQVSSASDLLDLGKRYELSHAPWAAFPATPRAAFAIGHGGDRIFLKFYVTEPDVMARQVSTNGPVHLDSCVEFFICFGTDRSYYNLEFGCSGTCHFGFGPSREQRSPIARHLVEKVDFQSRFRTRRSGPKQVEWELTLVIPMEVFSYHDFRSLDNQSCRVNFYKCGDDLPAPHYLAWADIDSEQPDFHLPQFFKKAHFTPKLTETSNSETSP